MSSNPFAQFRPALKDGMASPLDQQPDPDNPFAQFRQQQAPLPDPDNPFAQFRHQPSGVSAPEHPPQQSGSFFSTMMSNAKDTADFLRGKGHLPTTDVVDLPMDAAKGVLAGVVRGTGGLARAPTDIVNIVSPYKFDVPEPFRRFERHMGSVADDIKADSSDKTLAARDQLESAGTFGEVAKTLYKNPRLFTTEGAEVVGMLAPGGAIGRTSAALRAPLGVHGQVGIQGGMAAGITSGEVEEELRNMPFEELRKHIDLDRLKLEWEMETDEEVRDRIASLRATDAGAMSFGANVLLPYMSPGGRSIERMVARVASKRGGNAAGEAATKVAGDAFREGTGNVAVDTAISTLGEFVTEGAAGAAEQLGENIALFEDTWKGVSAAGALEGFLAAPIGGASGMSNARTERRLGRIRDGADLLSGKNVRDGGDATDPVPDMPGIDPQVVTLVAKRRLDELQAIHDTDPNSLTAGEDVEYRFLQRFANDPATLAKAAGFRLIDPPQTAAVEPGAPADPAGMGSVVDAMLTGNMADGYVPRDVAPQGEPAPTPAQDDDLAGTEWLDGSESDSPSLDGMERTTDWDALPVMTGRTWESDIGQLRADGDRARAERQKERELDALHDESVVPAAIYTAQERDAVRRAAGMDEAHPTAMQLAMQAARSATQVDEAASRAATAPGSDAAPPTEAQKKAGNYRKGHVKIDGLDVSIENPAGSERSGVDADGNAWSTRMDSHYGYIKGTRGADGDHIDVFVRPGFEGDANGPVFVIDQRNQDGSFDEHKVMLGFDSEAAAREAYLANYDEGWQGLGGMRRMSVDEFKDWSKRPRLSRRPVTVSGEGPTWRSDLETADLPGEVRAGLRARYESAERVLPTFEADLGEIAAAVGGRPIVAPLKGAGRASAKVMSDYGGDASRVADLVRGTVEVRLQTDADAVVEQLRSRYGDPVKLINSLDPSQPAPFASGYRDINSVWMIDGEPVEVQVNVPEMLAAKERAHPLYEEVQRIERAIEAENRRATGREEARLAELNSKQADIYGPAWEAAMRRMNSSSEISSASSRNRPLDARTGDPVDQSNVQAPGSLNVQGAPSTSPNLVPGGNSGSDAGGAAGDVGMGTTSDAILPQSQEGRWESFSPDSGSLGIPRSQMPQIKGEHREAFIRFLADRGIRSQPGEIKASSLKPTQADYSPTMVARFMRTGPIGERSVLVSSDGHVLDGHHQWMASRSTGASVPVIHLDAPIRELLDAANAFPDVQRSAGSDTVAGRAPIQPIQTGRSDVAYTASNEPVEFSYALVDDGALIASNEADGRINRQYPKELQPRDRSTAESRAQVQAIAGNLTPERLGESGDIVNGAPLVGPDGVVESGNGRVMALRSAPASRRAAYRQWLQGNAERFGLDPARVAASDAPVLVRIRQGDLPMSERARLGMEGNRSTQQALNPIEVARADARVIGDEMMALFEPSENGDVLAASNQPFLRAFAREIGGMEAAGLSSGGRWTKQMADRVNAAVFYRAYGDERLLSAFAAEADPDMKNILTALGRSARDFALARSEGAVEQGMDAGALLASAVQTLSDARSRDMQIGEYLAQGALLGDGPSAQVGQLATWLADNARRHRRLSDTLSDIGREIRNELASRQSGDMFGRTDRSLESIFDERIQDQQAESRSGVRESATEFGRADEPGDRADERRIAGERATDPVPGFQLAAPRGSIDAGARRDVTPRSGAQASLIPPATGREIVDDAVRKADDRLKGRDRPAAKPHEGDGELLAGPRPEQVDVEAEAPPRKLQADLPKTDQATYGNTRPLLDPQQRRDAASAEAPSDGRGPRPIRGQLDMFVVQRGDPAPNDAGRTRAEPAAQVDTDALTRELGPSARLVTTGEVHTGIEVVSSWQDAAHIVAPLRKSPQEVVAALVLDENNRPLAVIRHSVGKAAEASVEPWSLVGAVMSVPGARSVYFAHNHPSGDVAQSRADRGITGALGELMHDSGVKPKGMIVVGPGSTKASFIPFNVTTRPEVTDAVPAAARNKGAVPVQERALRRIGKGTGKRVTNPQSLIAQADQLFDGESGIVLLDNKHVPQATLQVSKKEMGQLRRGDPSQGVGRILSALAGANTNTAVVYGPAGREAANLVNMLHAADVRVLDHIVKKGGKWTSSAETPGGIPIGPGLFLSRSRSGPPARGIEPALLRTRINQITAVWKGNAPKVVVVDSPAGLPAWAQYSPAHVDAEGMYDPQSGTVYLVASNLPGMARARQVLAHEAVGHHGIEAIVGPEMWAQFAADVAAMRRDGRHRKLFEDIDSRYPGASEAVLLRETVAVMAERGIGRTWIDRMVAAVRRWLVDMGLVEGMTEDRIRQAIIAANRHVRRDEQSSFGVAGAEPAFSRNAHFSQLPDSEVQALVEQYADVDGAPSEASLRDAVKQFRDTERAYGGRDAWQRAHDAGRTKLNYGQWVQVRTPNFKKWFGDWEAVRAQERLDAMEPVTVRVPDEWRGLSEVEMRGKMAAALDAMVKRKATIPHPELGDIKVGRHGASKTEASSKDPVDMLIANDLEATLPKSIYARTAPSLEQGVAGYSKLLLPIRIDGKELVAILTVRRQTDGEWYYNTVTVSDAGKEKRPGSYASSGAGTRPLEQTPITGLNDFLRQPLSRVNPDTVSKVVDPNTGEPLVVYHGTGGDFTAFDMGRLGDTMKNTGLYGAGAYFSERSGTASSYADGAGRHGKPRDDGSPAAPNVMPAYLSIEDPLVIHQRSTHRGNVSQAERAESEGSLRRFMDQLVKDRQFGPNPSTDDVGSAYASVMDYIHKGDFAAAFQYLHAQLRGGEGITYYAKRAGFDGVVLNLHTESGRFMEEVVALDPTQIKSATGNVGTFDGSNPDIRFSRKGLPQSVKNLVALHNLSAENILFADRVGGLAAPSIAVARSDIGYGGEGFGSITLIAPKQLADPEAGTPVLDRDAYTQRFPEMDYPKPRVRQLEAFRERLVEAVGDTGGGIDADISMGQNPAGLLNELRNKGMSPAEVAYELKRASQVRMAYINQRDGVQMRLPMRDRGTHYHIISDPVLRRYIADNRHREHKDRQGYMDDLTREVVAALDRWTGDSLSAEHANGVREAMRKSLLPGGEIALRAMDRLHKDSDNWGKREVDVTALAQRLDKRAPMDDPGLNDWVMDIIGDVTGQPTITLRGRKVAPTLDNIVAVMTSGDVVGKEATLVTGSGDTAARMATRYRSLEQIKADRDRIVSRDQVTESRRDSETIVESYRLAALEHYSGKDWRGEVDVWDGMSAAMKSLSDAVKRSRNPGQDAVRSALNRNGFRNVPDDVVIQAMESIRALQDSPTNYFEAKPQRAVGLDEFRGAVVPRGTDPDVIRTLEKHGIEVRQYGKGEAAQQEATAKLARKLDRAENDILFSTRRKHTDAQKAFLAKAGLAPDTRTKIRQLYDRGMGHVQNLVRAVRDGDEIRQSTVDRFHGIRAAYTAAGHTDMLSMDGYMSARLSTGLPAIMEAVMMHGAPQWADGVLAIKDGTKGLLTALDPVQDRLDDWLGWMVARRAHVLMEQGRENLMTREDIDAGLALAEGSEAEFMQAAFDYLTIKNAILDVAEQAGLIDPVKRAVWDHAEYIPFYRDDKDSIGPGTRAGLSHQSSGIRTLRGGETALSDPLGNIVRNFTRLIDSSLKNNAMLETQSDLPAFFERVPDIDFVSAKVPLAQVRKHLIDAGMTEAALETIPKDALRGMADMWAMEPPAADDVVRIMRDGKAEHYRVEDPLLLRSLSAFATKERGAFMRSLIWAKRILTAGATGTAEFVGANYIRDALEGWMVSGVDFNPITDPMRGVLGALKRDDATKTLMMTGSYFAQGHLYGHDADATSAALRRSLRSKGVKNKDLESFVGTIFRGPAWGWDRWTHIQSSMEHGSRWAAYESAMAAGMTPKQAAFNAKDQFDFSMRGDSELLAFFTDTVPFLNARLQGLYKVGRAGHRNPKQLALRGGMLAMFSLALLAQNVFQYRDEYDELEEWDKDTYWHIGPGQPWHIRIPKPFELGLIFGTAIERGARALLKAGGSKAGEDTSKLWGSALRGVRDTLAVNFPQGALPILELWANKNTFTGRMIETPADQSRLPEARHNWRTSDTAKLMPASVSNVTGLSPKRVEHLWRAYTAGLGGYAIKMSDWLVRQAQDAPDRPAWHLRDYPGAGRFVRGDAPARSTSYQTEFWDSLKEAEKVENTVKEWLARAVRENRPELRKRALDKIEKHGDLLGPASYRRGAKAGVSFGMPTYLRRVSRQAQALSAQEEGIVMSRELSKKEKREQIDEMLRQRNALMAEAVEMIRAYGDQSPSQAPN